MTTIRDLLKLREEMVGNLRAEGARGSSIQISETLIGYPVIDVPTARDMGR